MAYEVAVPAMMIVLAILSVLPYDPPPARVDIVEVNHVYQDFQVTLEQVVWWDWCRQCGRYEVVDWRFLDRAGWPRLDGSGWRNEFTDQNGQRVSVLAKTRRETWTRYDVEADDRNNLAQDKRRSIR